MTEISYRAAGDCALHATVIGKGRALVLMHAGGPDHVSAIGHDRAFRSVSFLHLTGAVLDVDEYDLTQGYAETDVP